MPASIDPFMLIDSEIDLLRNASHGDPFSVLGVHADDNGRLWLRAILPGAAQVVALDAKTGELLGSLVQRHPDGFFEGVLTNGSRPAEPAQPDQPDRSDRSD